MNEENVKGKGKITQYIASYNMIIISNFINKYCILNDTIVIKSVVYNRAEMDHDKCYYNNEV